MFIQKVCVQWKRAKETVRAVGARVCVVAKTRAVLVSWNEKLVMVTTPCYSSSLAKLDFRMPLCSLLYLKSTPHLQPMFAIPVRYNQSEDRLSDTYRSSLLYYRPPRVSVYCMFAGRYLRVQVILAVSAYSRLR